MEFATCSENPPVESVNRLASAVKTLPKDSHIRCAFESWLKQNKKSKEVVYRVRYKMNKKIAGSRLWTTGMTFQNLPSNVRKFLVHSYCTDIDIKNAMPTIMNQLFENNGITTPLLKGLVENREKYLEVAPKTEWIRIMNGGKSSSSSPQLVKDYESEMKTALLELSTKNNYSCYFQEGKIRKPSNGDGVATSCLYADLERKVLTVMNNYLVQNNIKVVSLIHDGLLAGTTNFDELEQMENAIRTETGYNVNLTTKPLNDFNTTELGLDNLDEKKETVVDQTDTDACNLWLKHHPNFFKIAEKTWVLWNCTDKMWQYVYRDTDLIKYFDDQEYLDFQYKNYITNQRQLAVKVLSNANYNPDFLEDLATVNKFYLPLSDGTTFDFRTKKTVESSPDQKFFFSTKLNVDSQVDTGVAYDLIVSIFGQVKTEFFLKCLSRAVAGCVNDKRFYIVQGKGNSGKGVLTELIKMTFPSLSSAFNLESMGRKSSTGDEAKALSWMVGLKDKRVAISNEGSEQQILDKNMIKKATGGGETMSGRQNYKDEISFSPQTTFFAFVNDMPTLMSDQALRNRIVFIPTEYSYLNGNLYEEQKQNPRVKLGDPTIKDKIKEKVFIESFFNLVINSYVDTPPDIPEECLDFVEEYNEANSNEDELQSMFTDLFEPTSEQKDELWEKRTDYLSVQNILSKLRQRHPKAGFSHLNVKDVLENLGYSYARPYINKKQKRIWFPIREKMFSDY